MIIWNILYRIDSGRGNTHVSCNAKEKYTISPTSKKSGRFLLYKHDKKSEILTKGSLKHCKEAAENYDNNYEDQMKPLPKMVASRWGVMY